MKKAFLLMMVLMITAIAFAQDWFGLGRSVTATTTPQSASVASTDGVTFPETVSVYNSGTNLIYAAVNCTTGELASAISASTAIVVPADMTFTFNRSRTPDQIHNVCVATSAGTSLTYIAAY